MTIAVMACLLFLSPHASAFTTPFVTTTTTTSSRLYAALPTAEESAKALGAYMAKAHEDKLKAVKDAEAKSKGTIQALETEVASLKAQLESGYLPPKQQSADSSTTTGGITSYEMPVTNKAMSDKLHAYRTFCSKYIVTSQQNKYDAIKETEAKLKASYEAQLKAAMEGVMQAESK